MHNPVGRSFCNAFCTQFKTDKDFRVDIALVAVTILLAVGIILAMAYTNPRGLLDMKTPHGIFICAGWTGVNCLAILKVETIFRKIWNLQGAIGPGEANPI